MGTKVSAIANLNVEINSGSLTFGCTPIFQTKYGINKLSISNVFVSFLKTKRFVLVGAIQFSKLFSKQSFALDGSSKSIL